jgi:hypothetical protein
VKMEKIAWHLVCQLTSFDVVALALPDKFKGSAALIQ